MAKPATEQSDQSVQREARAIPNVGTPPVPPNDAVDFKLFRAGSLDHQVNLLSNPDFPAIQRQKIASHIGMTQGNRHLHRVLSMVGNQADYEADLLHSYLNESPLEGRFTPSGEDPITWQESGEHWESFDRGDLFGARYNLHGPNSGLRQRMLRPRPEVQRRESNTVDQSSETSRTHGRLGRISTEDVVQGNLSDCYLLSALITLTNSEEGRNWLQESIRPTDTANQFRVRLFERRQPQLGFDERWFTVTTEIDPTNPLSGAREAAPWVRAIERAYAILYGGGQTEEALQVIGQTGRGGTQIGGAQRALEHLTGRPASRDSINAETNQDTLWIRLRQALEDGQLVVAGTSRGADTPQMNELGIYGFHNYPVIGVSGEGSRRTVRVRSPWGQRYRQREWSIVRVVNPHASNDPEFEIDFEIFRQAFVHVSIGNLPLPVNPPESTAPTSQSNASSEAQGQAETLEDVVPAPEAIGLSIAVYRETQQRMRANRRQEALDILVNYLISAGQINASFLLAGRMYYDEGIPETDEGQTLPPGYEIDSASGAQRAREAIVQIGPRAFQHGVPLLYSTVRHEYQHVLQFQEPDNTLSSLADLRGTGGQLGSSEFQEGLNLDDPSQREEFRQRRSLLNELVNRQETEAYAQEILDARMTGMYHQPDLMLRLWRELLGVWTRLRPVSKQLLNDLCVRAHAIAEEAVGQELPFTPAN